MKLSGDCGDKSGKVVKISEAVYGLKQAGRRWAMHLDGVIVRKIGMEQFKADPCVFRLIRDGVVVMIVCVHVDDIILAGESEACDFQSTSLLEKLLRKASAARVNRRLRRYYLIVRLLPNVFALACLPLSSI